MIYITALQDLYSWKIARYWVYSLVITTLVLAMLWGTVFGTVFRYMDSVEELLAFNLTFALPGWLVSTLWGWLFGAITMASWVASTYLFSVMLLFFLGFYTAPVVREIRRKHYLAAPIPKGGSLADETLGLLGIILKYAVVFLGVMFISLLLFPIAPLLYFVWGLMLFRRLLIADVASNVNPAFNHPATRLGLWASSLLVYLMTLVPMVNLIAPVYGVVLFSHLMLQKVTVDTGDNNEPLAEGAMLTTGSTQENRYKGGNGIDEVSGD